MRAVRLIKIFPVAALIGLTACADAGDRGLGPACASGLNAAERALSKAKANSIGKAADWAAAATLIAAGRAQQQFEEYENCVGKARQAQKILAKRN